MKRQTGCLKMLWSTSARDLRELENSKKYIDNEVYSLSYTLDKMYAEEITFDTMSVYEMTLDQMFVDRMTFDEMALNHFFLFQRNQN